MILEIASSFVIVVLAWIVWYVLRRPLRRQEHARFVLDVIESALQQGESIEHRIISLSRSKDAALGVHFHLLAAYLEQGQGLIGASEKVPELLPAQLLAMLKAGEALNDYSQVLPAGRNLLHDGTSQTRALINYQVIFALLLNPLILFLLVFIVVKVVPVFFDIYSSMGLRSPSLSGRLMGLVPILFWGQLAMVLLIYGGAALVLGGARFVSWMEAGTLLGGCVDWFLMRVPWRRKRLQRDFSAMLALLLDTGVPEERAVSLAASSTANRYFMHRSEQVIEQLRQGIKLTEAIQGLDDTGEFRWRLSNAAHGAGHFFKALKGWHESLDAAAFKQEQAAAQVISTSLVVLNGLMVGVVAIAVMQWISGLGVATLAHPQ